MQKAFLKIREMRMEFPDGSIVGLGRAESIDTGWVVKQKVGQNLEGEDGMMEAVKIALGTTNTVAGYRDGETELWDVVEIFENEDEATNSKALLLINQPAIFD